MHHFFAYLSRLRHISRWNLMRNFQRENVLEHTCEVAMIAHALCVIENTRYGGKLNPDRAASLALYHETGEVITGDLATPIKYFNQDISAAFKQIEAMAEQKVCAMLPEDLKPAYEPLIMGAGSQSEWPYVKAADKICAYLKCVQEIKCGNAEFQKAMESTKAAIDLIDLPAAKDFMREFAPSYALALDELNEYNKD